jgi:outer membrane protein assembly factor BamB
VICGKGEYHFRRRGSLLLAAGAMLLATVVHAQVRVEVRSADDVRVNEAGSVDVKRVARTQAPVVVQVRPRADVKRVTPSRGPDVEESPEVANLLQKADEAIARGDWKLAIDSLQRVIDSPHGLLPSPADKGIDRYESPRYVAKRVLASFPKEGLDAYRVLYDGRAKGLIDRARRDHDLSALRHVVDHYALTSHGAEAVALLASWFLDDGRPSAALRILDEHLRLDPADSDPSAQVVYRLAVAQAMLGDRESAESTLTMAPTVSGDAAKLDRQVRAFIDQFDPPSSDEYRALSEWVGQRGGGSCRGLMDPVVPTFAEDLPWRVRMPSAPDAVWTELDGLRAEALPVSTAVVAGDLLFVKAGSRCLAVDLSSFGVAWSSRPSAEGMLERAMRRSSGSPASDRVLFSNYVEGTLSTSDGLVFSIESASASLSEPDSVTQLRLRTPNQASTTDAPVNRLVAYDASTGDVRWARGGADDVDEQLSQAKFLSPPVGIDGRLWVPYEAGNAVFVGALDPANGDLTRSMLLCALGGREIEAGVALFTANADGVLYVPTNHGLLFAVDTTTDAIRWASRYHESPDPKYNRRRRRPTAPAAKHWLPGPPVVVDRLVLLAPTDESRLLAFDRDSGRLVWSFDRDEHRYIVAADREHVWLGGRELSAVSLHDRSVVWARRIERATGRAVLSGQMIYQPTRDGLSAIDAMTGDVVEEYDLPADQPALGNLLCISSSMISVDPTEVRAFPDRNSYAATLAAHQADPRDARSAVRLAFLEMLKGEPQRALDVLVGMEMTKSEAKGSLGRHATHLRVEALIKLSRAPGIRVDESVDRLRSAVSIATGDRDRIAATLALGDKLRRVGRYQQAYDVLWELGTSPSSQDEIVVSGPLQRPVRHVVAEMLRRIEPELGPGDVAGFGEKASAFLNRGLALLDSPETRIEGTRLLRLLAEAGTLDGWDQAALVALGRFESDRGKYERGEQYLLEAARRGTSRVQTAAALLGLADLYIEQSPSMARSARDVVERLGSVFADVQVGGRTVASLMDGLRSRIDSSAASRHDDYLDPSPFVVSDRLAYPMIIDDEVALRMVRLGDQNSEPFADRQLVMAAPGKLRSYLAMTGAMEWEAELQVGYDFTYGGIGETAASGPRVDDEPATVFVDGETAIVNSPEGVHAVGVISGRRLWAEPIRGRVFLRDRTTDVGAGRVICMLRPTLLSALSVIDGKVVWRRDVESEPGGVYVRDGFVVTVDPDTEILQTYSLRTGEFLARLSFHQPESVDESGAFIPVSYHDGIFCGPDERSVTAYDGRTGERIWSLALPDEPVNMFEPAEGKVVVSTADGRYWMIDTYTGEVLIEHQFDALAGGAVDGHLDGETLVLVGYSETIEGDLWQLIGTESRTGAVRWSRSFLGTVSGSQLRLVDGLIPVLEIVSQKSTGADRSPMVERQTLVLIDTRTGDVVGDPVVWAGYAAGNRLTGEMSVRPGRMLLQSAKGIVALETEPRSGENGQRVD